MDIKRDAKDSKSDNETNELTLNSACQCNKRNDEKKTNSTYKIKPED